MYGSEIGLELDEEVTILCNHVLRVFVHVDGGGKITMSANTDLTRRGFIGRVAAVAATLGVGAKATDALSSEPASMFFIKQESVPGFDPGNLPDLPVYIPDFIPSRVFPVDSLESDVTAPVAARYPAAVPIRAGQLVRRKRKRVHPVSVSSSRIVGVAQNDARPGESVTVLIGGAVWVRTTGVFEIGGKA